MSRLEHELIFCPICQGHAGCLECADGRTFEAYCQVQDILLKEDRRERAQAQMPPRRRAHVH